MKNFNDKIGLRTILRDLPIPESTSNNRYEKEDLIESFLLSVWLNLLVHEVLQPEEQKKNIQKTVSFSRTYLLIYITSFTNFTVPAMLGK